MPRKKAAKKPLGPPSASDKLAAERHAAKLASAQAAAKQAAGDREGSPSGPESDESCCSGDGREAEGRSWDSDEGEAAAQEAADRGEAAAASGASARALPLDEGAKPKRMKKKLKKLRVNLSMCKYPVIRDMVEYLGWTNTEHDSEWHIWWTDMSVGEERCMRLRRPQKLNHFPGMTEIAHKCKLARNLNRLRNVIPELYNFHPETFNLPVDYLAFENAALGDQEQRKGKGGKSNKSYIIKPDDGACGVGIFITRKPSAVPPKLSCVAQRYLNKPLLIDGRKFDLRLYVLVTSMTPLRVYLFPEGLARFATEQYEPVTAANINKRYMHLTNFSVNRNHKQFETDESAEAETGSKRSLVFVRKWLEAQGFDVANVWNEIEKVIVKTLLAIQPSVSHTYRTCISSNNDCAGFSCFDLLGFDIMLDHKAKPWIIEVNEMPSFETAAAIDLSTKSAVLYETMRLVCPTVQELRLLTEMTKAVKLAKATKATERMRGKSPASVEAAGKSAQEPGEPERMADAHIREELVALRLRQEAYQRTRFRLLYPLSDPVEDGRCTTADMALRKSLPRRPLPPRYAQEPECIELGLAEELWAFQEASEAEALERDRAFMAEYEQCAQASEEIFANSLWLRLGKAPLKQQMTQMGLAGRARMGAQPVMVQAGQGALLAKLRQERQHQNSPDMHACAGEGQGSRAPGGDRAGRDGTPPAGSPLASGRRNGECSGGSHHRDLQFVMGGGGAVRMTDVGGEIPSANGWSNVNSGHPRPPSLNSPDSPARTDRAGVAAGGSNERGAAGLHGVHLPGMSGAHNPSNNLVLQRLSMLRRELDEKRTADRGAIAGIGGTAYSQSYPRRHSSSGGSSARRIDGAHHATDKGPQIIATNANVLYSRPHCPRPNSSTSKGAQNGGRSCRGEGASMGQALDLAQPGRPMQTSGMRAPDGEGPSNSSASARIRSAPRDRSGERKSGSVGRLAGDEIRDRGDRVREILRANTTGGGVESAGMTVSRAAAARTVETARREVQTPLYRGNFRVASSLGEGVRVVSDAKPHGLFRALEPNVYRDDAPRITVQHRASFFSARGIGPGS